MPFYYRLGQLPQKRHVQFRRPDGVLYSEELFGTEGFVGPSSTMYHINPPTQVYGWKTLYSTKAQYVEVETMRMRHVKSAPMRPFGEAVTGRVILFGNSDVEMAVCNPSEQMPYYYKNSQGDECLFIHFGSGVCYTMLGALRFKPHDYIVIPKGIIFKLVWDEAGAAAEDLEMGGPKRKPAKRSNANAAWKPAGAPDHLSTADMPLGKFLLIETMNGSHIGPPPRYVSKAHGQFLEHAPYCERDLRLPVHEPDSRLPMFVEAYADYEVRVKARDCMHSYVFHYHPLDIVGWDGCYYPHIFNIDDFSPITGKLHMPPPIHQTFEAHNFVICSFCPRLLDYHPQAIKVPYNHSNIDSDEVLYYVEGNFGSRKGIEVGSLTLHPQGIPHGPHPGTTEASMAHDRTHELAVMCDTFRPLFATKAALGLEDLNYPASWEGEHFPRLAKGEAVLGGVPRKQKGKRITARFGTLLDAFDNALPPASSVSHTPANVWAPNAPLPEVKSSATRPPNGKAPKSRAVKPAKLRKS